MSLKDFFKAVKNGFYKGAVQKARAAIEKKGAGNKTDLVCFVGNPPNVSFIQIDKK
ncbi:hypothetical protein [Aureispira sp. CCB-E]|uniref:hypothetical protein n=1 Tax=Aureispira sp. CCB-E TaxID=3051121 RepID=UPI002868FFE5|nr:hypothetical protein [Aureispira sp. CCB-E]WMX16538.1 hypothetical protein QP953_09180 [Aureispira sp. CCB-E]